MRLDLEPGGCCGTAYSFAASLPRGEDFVFGCDGAQLAVSPEALEVLPGATGDYGARLKPPRYVADRPMPWHEEDEERTY